MNPSNQLIQKVRALCSNAYVEFKRNHRTHETLIHGFRTRLFKQYKGGNSLLKFVRDCDLTVVDCGGQLLVVTTLPHFLEVCAQSEQHVSPIKPSLESSELFIQE